MVAGTSLAVSFCCMHVVSLRHVDLGMLRARLDTACRLHQLPINGYCTLPRRPAARRCVSSGSSQQWLSLTTAGRCVHCFSIILAFSSFFTTSVISRTSSFTYVWYWCLQKEMATYRYLCLCGETQTMSHIVKSCPLTKLNGSLSRLHSADEDAVSWLTSYGS